MAIPPADPGVARAEGLLRRPLWLGGETDEPSVVTDPGALVDELEACLGGRRLEGHAFHRAWPALLTAHGAVVPGVPTVVDGTAETADGRYLWQDRRLRRVTSVGAETVWSPDPPGIGPAAVALWFSDSERFRLTSDVLEIGNDQLRAVLPATPTVVTRAARASQRSLAPLLASWSEPSSQPLAALAVGREEALMGRRWLEPEAVLAARLEVTRVTVAGARAEIELVDGERLILELTTATRGWRLDLVSGRWLFNSLEVVGDGERVLARVTPGTTLDLGSATTRARVAFDLLAGLMEVAD